MVITITGLSIQADVLGEGDKAEAGQLIDAVNTAIAGMNSNPHIFGAGDIDESQIQVELTEDEQQMQDCQED